MRREELEQLHYIAPLANIASILSLGILSHKRAARVEHDTVAMPEIQERREKVVVPGGRPLHEYVNLYINARNKMMYKVKCKHGTRGLCVIRVSTQVLDLPDVVIADQNASSDYVRFASSPWGLTRIDKDLVYARSWKHADDPIEEMRHGSIMCSEVLVPEKVESRFILGVYAPTTASVSKIKDEFPDLSVTSNGDLFFR